MWTRISFRTITSFNAPPPVVPKLCLGMRPAKLCFSPLVIPEFSFRPRLTPALPFALAE